MIIEIRCSGEQTATALINLDNEEALGVDDLRSAIEALTRTADFMEAFDAAIKAGSI